jgi:hypothetical protein
LRWEGREGVYYFYNIYLKAFFLLTVVKLIDGQRLILNGVQRTDMGGYLCIASNGIPPSVSKRYDVHINCKYPLRKQKISS